MRKLLLLMVGCWCGCGNTPAAGTGAREAAQHFFEALAQSDWSAAYAQLHPASQKKLDPIGFQKRAQAYCQQLGFTLGEVQIRTCEEQGDRAIAHVTLHDAAGARQHGWRDSIALERTPTGWGVVLPAQFGRKR